MGERDLNFLQIAFMYVGTLIGAGFASGREMWQYFGVFGGKGIIGVICNGLIYMAVAILTAILARMLQTSRIDRIVLPSANEKARHALRYIMSALLFTSLINMSAAAGSLVLQEFGISKFVGSIVITVLTVVTVCAGFHKMSRVFSMVIPFLIIIMMIVCLCTVFGKGINLDMEPTDTNLNVLTDNIPKSVILYSACCSVSIIPMVATSAYDAKSQKHAIAGAILGSVVLLGLNLLMYLMLTNNPAASHIADMPILVYAGRISKVVSAGAIFVMCMAMYSCATGNFYGFATVFKDDNKKWIKVSIAALIAFFCSMMGFKNFIKYFLPINGILGVVMVILLLVNFIKCRKLFKQNLLENETDKIQILNDLELEEI